MVKGSFFGAPVYSLAGDLKIVNEYHPAVVLSLIYNKFFYSSGEKCDQDFLLNSEIDIKQ